MIGNILPATYADYIREMMNVGAGNAATALEQLLKRRFDMRIPSVHVIEPVHALSVIGTPSMPTACVKMDLVGDITGEMFFIVPSRHVQCLIGLAESSYGDAAKEGETPDYSVLTEIGNILSGVYLTAIHDFCSLNIYHTVPILAEDMMQAVMDETVAKIGLKERMLIIIVNEFKADKTGEEPINTYLIMVPSTDSLDVLVQSMAEARKKLYGD